MVKKTMSDCCARGETTWVSDEFWPKQKESTRETKVEGQGMMAGYKMPPFPSFKKTTPRLVVSLP